MTINLDRKAKFDWMQKEMARVASDFKKAFPNAIKGEWKYILFNTVKWD